MENWFVFFSDCLEDKGGVSEEKKRRGGGGRREGGEKELT